MRRGPPPLSLPPNGSQEVTMNRPPGGWTPPTGESPGAGALPPAWSDFVAARRRFMQGVRRDSALARLEAAWIAPARDADADSIRER